MRAVVQTRYGDPSQVLAVRQVDRPSVGDDEVLVRVGAASVHRRVTRGHRAAGGVDDAVATLRELAHGIYPPLLAADGLPVALQGQARKATIPLQVIADGIGRYSQEVEAAGLLLRAGSAEQHRQVRQRHRGHRAAGPHQR